MSKKIKIILAEALVKCCQCLENEWFSYCSDALFLKFKIESYCLLPNLGNITTLQSKWPPSKSEETMWEQYWHTGRMNVAMQVLLYATVISLVPYKFSKKD